MEEKPEPVQAKSGKKKKPVASFQMLMDEDDDDAGDKSQVLVDAPVAKWWRGLFQTVWFLNAVGLSLIGLHLGRAKFCLLVVRLFYSGNLIHFIQFKMSEIILKVCTTQNHKDKTIPVLIVKL